ncbi:hypothetical protein pb186bvf_004565 [Paramecium bursaria]
MNLIIKEHYQNQKDNQTNKYIIQIVEQNKMIKTINNKSSEKQILNHDILCQLINNSNQQHTLCYQIFSNKLISILIILDNNQSNIIHCDGQDIKIQAQRIQFKIIFNIKI